MGKARFGVIGLGPAGERHIQAYRQHPDAELTAVCDPDGARLSAIGARYGVERCFADYAEIVTCDEVDAVSIVSPELARTEVVAFALEHGKHVLVDRPPATTIQDCERIGRELRARPVKLMVDFRTRWCPGVAQIKERMQRGQLGEPLMAYCRLSDSLPMPAELSSGPSSPSVNWLLGSHCVDTLQWLLEDEVSRVYSVSRSRVLKGMGFDTPDFCQSVLEFVRGASAVLETCWVVAAANPRLPDLKLELVCEKGTAYLDGAPGALAIYTAQGGTCPDTSTYPLVHGRTVGFAIESILHFAGCVAADTEPMTGFEDACDVTRVVCAMEQSARTGQPVSLL